MKPKYKGSKVTVYHGDCLDVLKTLKDNSIDAVVTDPPYALSFMGKDWDSSHPDPAVWQQCLRVLKPGGYLLSFGGTRTWHRLACDIEDAGFEIRDNIAWIYGSGFPKSLDVSKAIDKAAGVEREIVGVGTSGKTANMGGLRGIETSTGQFDLTAPASDAAKQWAGWGTALKPAFEPIIVARKPIQGTVAANVVEHGTGALNSQGFDETERGDVKPKYKGSKVTVYHGDCLDVLKTLKDNSIDAVVTDPPYGLGFMGKDWDTIGMDVGRGAQARSQRAREVTPKGKGHSTSAGPYLAAGVDSLRAAGAPYQTWCIAWASECLRVLKPGGHMLAFGGTRTWHRLACAIEDAGFEIRDSIAWLYGSGFPKSLDVSKAIDKAAGAEREVIGHRDGSKSVCNGPSDSTGSHIWTGRLRSAEGITDAAKQWQGWGTALKPAFEPIIVTRKPIHGTVAANVLEHGTGALNIDASRVGTTGGSTQPSGMDRYNAANAAHGYRPGAYAKGTPDAPTDAGRWPANVVLDGPAANELDKQSGVTRSTSRPRHNTAEAHNKTSSMGKSSGDWTTGGHGDEGASRFFPVFRYQAKAPKTERPNVREVAHPTVKPLELMRWLVKLVTQPGGVVLDPFAGTGTTIEAAILEGMKAIAIEREADYIPLITKRIQRCQRKRQ